MPTYRTGNHWGVTIVREDAWIARGVQGDELVAVVTNGDKELAERICALLNDSGELPDSEGTHERMAPFTYRERAMLRAMDAHNAQVLADSGSGRAEGYRTAIDILSGVADRTGSPAAKWAADYLEADPDRMGPLRALADPHTQGGTE